MKPADKIRAMTDEELNMFLWGFKLNSISRFLEEGGAGLMDAHGDASMFAERGPGMDR